jgi:hypothetical protein
MSLRAIHLLSTHGLAFRGLYLMIPQVALANSTDVDGRQFIRVFCLHG